MDVKKTEVRTRMEKVDRLAAHKYDPNCKFCTDNSFVKDAMQAKEDLVRDRIEAGRMMDSLADLNAQHGTYQWVEKSYEMYTDLLKRRGGIKDSIATNRNNLITIENEIDNLERRYKISVEKIAIYNKNKESVESNMAVESRIMAFRRSLNTLTQNHRDVSHRRVEIAGKVEVAKSRIETLSETVDMVRALEIEKDIYDIYMSAVGRDGIPYKVICHTVPAIEREINSILEQVVDYTIQMETDGKNIVPYVVYDYGKWPIELTSGYERFVASIAIRIALSEVSNLPKTTALFVDEGMGTLDSENLSSMPRLFSFLKHKFDFVVLISHIDGIKDMVDKQIEIKQDNNLSKVIVE